MLIEKNAQYYLKRTRAFAKEIEFDIPEELRAQKDINIDELFPVAIACIADLSADIVRGKESDEQIKTRKKELYFASKFYDSYLHLNSSNRLSDRNYFNLIGAIAYYLCDQIGSSIVLIKNIDVGTLDLSPNKLDILIYHLLNNDPHIDELQVLISDRNEYISEFVHQYNKLMTRGIKLDRNYINKFKQSIYETNNFRDIFLVDALLAIFIIKINHSIFKMLPQSSNIPLDLLVKIVNSGHFVRELWPSQRYMCEMGFFKGKSGVIQMPTGAGKTKAMSMAVLSAFCSETIKLSIVIAPFRALCREISNDLKHDLKFDTNIQISEISDLLQSDYVLEDLFNPERKTVVVTTPEKFLYILRQDESIIESIGQLIFDEGHLFDDEERGATYELLLSSIIKQVDSDVQKILISAIIPNVGEINNWFTRGNGVAFSGDDISAVDKLPAALKWVNIGGAHYGYLYYINKEDYSSFDFFVPRMIEINPLEKRSNEKQRYFPSVDFSHGKMKEKNDMAIACLLRIVPRDNVAIFCGRKDSANKILSRILELNSRGYDVSDLKNRANLNEISKISNLIAKNYGTDEPLYQAAQLGVFAHHAGVSDGIKNSVEFALKKSMITNVICTSTLAQGVNLPIKYLVVSSVYQAGEQIKVRDFHNLIGRTARSGMFTEGTIIFSDPFAFNTNQWKWDQYKYLLNPNNSESCTSIILDVVKQHSMRNKSSCCFYDVALMRYTDFKKFQETKDLILSNFDKDSEIFRLFKHVLNILSRIENYAALAIANNDNTYTEDFADELLNDTLAESVASEEEKAKLKTLFEKICEYISNTLQDESSKRNFARSMISCESYIDLQGEIHSTNLCSFTDDELLNFVIQKIIKYSAPRHLHKIVKIEDAIEIAKMWMNGQGYYIIQSVADLFDYKIVRRNQDAIISLEEIVSICDGDFGYSASLIINSICEILKSNDSVSEEDDGDNFLETIESLQKLSQKLKYGLSEQTDIFIYELGFNDRFLAQEIRKIIGIHFQKKEVKKAIKQNRTKIEFFLYDYPSVFQNRLKNL